MTLYIVRFTFPSGRVTEQTYTSMTERALAVISYSSYASKVEMFEKKGSVDNA